MIKITALPGLLCLAACGQQNSGLEQNVGSQSATPSQKASQQEASLKQQEASQKQQKASLKQKETEAEKVENRKQQVSRFRSFRFDFEV